MRHHEGRSRQRRPTAKEEEEEEKIEEEEEDGEKGRWSRKRRKLKEEENALGEACPSLPESLKSPFENILTLVSEEFAAATTWLERLKRMFQHRQDSRAAATVNG